ncbi:MAG: NAD+ synthase [Thermoplasmata archaeon]|nr:NAD+ synthase [Thermoplasmata archaeon]
MSDLTPRLTSHALATISEFLRAHVADAQAERVVIGLSGGIDSALVARIARDALGPERVMPVLLPDAAYPAALSEETIAYARSLGTEPRVIPIDSAEAALRQLLPELKDRLTWGNTKARLRMTIVYALAREHRGLVLGTGNKSEILLGYFTKHGDGGVDLLPLGDLYKSEIQELARQLELPAAIRERAPTAGLWEGQTDEAELGGSYARIDRILLGLEELRSEEEIARVTGESPERVREIADRVGRFRHKRRSAPIPKVRLRTIGIDWRD